jgi:hypothetical protein
MLVDCRLAGLSGLGAHYAGVKWRAMRDKRCGRRPRSVVGRPQVARAFEKPWRSRRRVGIAERGVPPAPSGGARKKGTGG